MPGPDARHGSLLRKVPQRDCGCVTSVLPEKPGLLPGTLSELLADRLLGGSEVRRSVWLAVLLTTLTAWADETCPAETLEGFDPKTWGPRVTSATTCGLQAAALASAGFDGLVSCEDRRAPAPLNVLSASVSPRWRSVEGRAVHLVTLGYQWSGDGPHAASFQKWSMVLAARPRRWCRVDLSELASRDLLPNECSTGEGRPTSQTFTIEQVISPSRDALHLTTEHPSCGVSGCDRQGVGEESWWEVRDQRLLVLLQLETWQSSYSACRRAGEMMTREVGWEGSWPRVAVVLSAERRTTCAAAFESSEQDECTEQSSDRTERWRWNPTAQVFESVSR